MSTPHITELRQQLLDTLKDLRNREQPMEPDRARAIAQVAGVLVDMQAALSDAQARLSKTLVAPAAPVAAQPDLHSRTADLVDRFAAALKEKLADAERKYGYSDGWAEPDWMQECRAELLGHIAKGDPRDVAAYCAFLWHHGESTAGASQEPRKPQPLTDEQPHHKGCTCERYGCRFARDDARDAARYRWLKDTKSYHYFMSQDSPAECGIEFGWQQAFPHEASWRLDDAIDAAMKDSASSAQEEQP